MSNKKLIIFTNIKIKNMTYSEAISVLVGIHNGLPSNYVLKGSFWTAIGNLNADGGGGSDSDLQVCDAVYNSYYTSDFTTALDVISRTVNPNGPYYPSNPH